MLNRKFTTFKSRTNHSRDVGTHKRKMITIIERLINTHFCKLPPPANNPYDIPVLKTNMKSKYSLTYIFSTTPSLKIDIILFLLKKSNSKTQEDEKITKK